MNSLRLVGVLAIVAPCCLAVTVGFAQTPPAVDSKRCGAVVTIQTRSDSATRFAFVPPGGAGVAGTPITLALFAGGSGHVHLDENGCPRNLKGNSLVRSIPIFNAAGFGTALIDAPTDFQGEDGLAGFRTAARHAEDIGKVIAELRARTQGQVWVAGTSRGSISAANAASRLSGAAAPDGVVLTSALMVGQSGAKKSWVAQSVFDLSIENIRIPILVIGHAADRCIRSPAGAMGRMAARIQATRQQVVMVTGGPGPDGPAGLDACEGRTPHGFIDQEAEVAAGMARFIRGDRY